MEGSTACDASATAAVTRSACAASLPYSEDVANRDIRIWHLVIENGY
jgi:hypothetical protein